MKNIFQQEFINTAFGKMFACISDRFHTANEIIERVLCTAQLPMESLRHKGALTGVASLKLIVVHCDVVQRGKYQYFSACGVWCIQIKNPKNSAWSLG